MTETGSLGELGLMSVDRLKCVLARRGDLKSLGAWDMNMLCLRPVVGKVDGIEKAWNWSASMDSPAFSRERPSDSRVDAGGDRHFAPFPTVTRVIVVVFQGRIMLLMRR